MAGSWEISIGLDADAEEFVTTQLVAYNKQQSALVRDRFRPENLRPRPVAAYARDGDRVVGGCAGSTVDVWGWLTIDLMWVAADYRGLGLGGALLTAVEGTGIDRGCRWAKLNTWDFQGPGFYERRGYVEYGREVDYPPGHTNFLLRKDLRPAAGG